MRWHPIGPILAVVALLTAGAPGVMAQSMIGGGDSPVEIDAQNGIEWQRDTKAYIARGDAHARRNGVEIRADTLTAFYRDGPDGKGQEIYRIDADGKVQIHSASERAYGDKGVYHVEQAVLVLIGKNLKLETQSAVITARDTLEYWDKKHLAVARGDAIVNSQKGRLRADILTAHIAQDGKRDLKQIDAFGHVLVSTGTEIARGEEGVYNPRTGLATLCGNVKITRGKNQLNGRCAEVNLVTGISRLVGGGGRVKGLITPEK
jgi:lipopolysaccharide export system protein LptA